MLLTLAPLLPQLALPLALLAWVSAGPHASRAGFLSAVVLTGACILTLDVVGLWLALPWYAPIAYAGALAFIVARRWPRVRETPRRPAEPRELLRVIGAGVLTAAALGVLASAMAGRRPPAAPVDLVFPFDRGTFLAVNGGSQSLINAHLATLEGERARDYRGQSYGLDLVRLGTLGLRAPGLLPSDPAAYAIFGEPVLSPCAGRVVAAVDGAPDMSPPDADRSQMAGNYIIVACKGVWVVLAHLRRGSVEVREGAEVTVGMTVGRAGNSGNTSEPHLHVHAQRPGTPEAPLGGEPVPVRLDGRYLVRGDRFRPSR